MTAVHEIEVRLSFLVLPLIIFSEKISKEKINKIFIYFKYWVLSFAVFLIIHKLFFVGGPVSTISTHSLLFITNIHQSYFSLFYIFCLFFVLQQIKNGSIHKISGYFQLSFLLIFITLLGARVTTFYALLVCIGFFTVQILRSKRNSKIILISILILSSYLMITKTSFINKFYRLAKIEWNIEKNIYNHQVFTFDYDDKTSNSLELRLIKWYCAIKIVKENILVGVGSGDYQIKLNEKYEEIDFKKGMVYKYNTHNQFLEEFVKFGIIGGVFFLFFLMFLFYTAFIKKNKLLTHLLLVMFLFLFIESVFTRQHGVVFFVFLISILSIYHDKKSK
ncbi:O-antigen ligase family protein [Lutibacter sp. Hel_I_33_5]|uniref:O-antigen ligase family protein n=1 Tax=Lutibacter sp. Hel_I_33_5 TaxID=1566289 RepID=UPI00164617C6|nr:O-antigen ligase family protein [Lutibacter sp. Hel_I_33_5]